VNVFLSLRYSTSVVHLQLIGDGISPLSETFLSDIGSVPASLKYITWDSDSDLVTYRLELREGKTVAVPAELPYSEETGWNFWGIW
jgi:hypothetical protein